MWMLPFFYRKRSFKPGRVFFNSGLPGRSPPFPPDRVLAGPHFFFFADFSSRRDLLPKSGYCWFGVVSSKVKLGWTP